MSPQSHPSHLPRIDCLTDSLSGPRPASTFGSLCFGAALGTPDRLPKIDPRQIDDFFSQINGISITGWGRH